MISHFFCGSFRNQAKEDKIIDTSRPCSTPKRSRKRNRYANLGLDKYNTLLSELEEKRQKIYTEKGAEDIDLVEFVISSDNEIEPIIVKRLSDASSKTSHILLQVSEKQKKHIQTSHEASSSYKNLEVEESHKKKKRGSWASWHFKLEKFRQPFYYLPAVLILILLCLAIYGRPFAILSTSIGWYLIPLLKGWGRNSSSNDDTNNNQRKLKRKKEHYSRRLLNEKIVVRNSNNNDGSSSPTSVFNGPAGASPPRRHDHRRSW